MLKLGILILPLISLVSGEVINVNGNVTAIVPERFVGVTIDSGVIQDKWRTMNFTSKKMKTLARELSPSYLRVGGTLCDFLIFNMTEDTTLRFKPHKPRYIQINGEWIDANTNFTMTPYDWDLLNIFAMESGWDLIFDFNVFLRKNGQWDPTNAIELLKYTIQQGYKPAGYELGNEPDLFPSQFPKNVVSPQQLAKDYQTFISVIKNSGVTNYVINGPETAGGYVKYFPE